MATTETVGSPRELLIDAGARLLAEQGPEALTARRLAREVGASTMVVYTHFGSMEQLRRAIREAGYARLAEAWGTVAQTSDPVADLSVSGASYLAFALANPNLYRAMFFEVSGDDPAPPPDLLGTAVQFAGRCIDAGRFSAADPESVMWQLWAATHGIVAGVLAGMIRLEEIEGRMRPLGVTLYTGFGDEREAAERSMVNAGKRLGEAM